MALTASCVAVTHVGVCQLLYHVICTILLYGLDQTVRVALQAHVHQLAVAAGDAYVRVYDRRMLSPGTEYYHS